jgi:hypothetical protein
VIKHQITGSWLRETFIDKEVLWKLEMYAPYKVLHVDHPLPSDSRYREDLIELIKGDDKKADEEKERLENFQRKDRKLREAKEKERQKQAKKKKK